MERGHITLYCYFKLFKIDSLYIIIPETYSCYFVGFYFHSKQAYPVRIYFRFFRCKSQPCIYKCVLVTSIMQWYFYGKVTLVISITKQTIFRRKYVDKNRLCTEQSFKKKSPSESFASVSPATSELNLKASDYFFRGIDWSIFI